MILILAFGSVLAMGLPIGVALFGIGIGTAILTALSHVATVPEDATFIGIMIGLGIGIDPADPHPLPRAAARRAHRV